MEKALMFLKHMKQTDTPYNFRECELDEAIKELEEAMKPKTCVGCKYMYHKEDTEFLVIHVREYYMTSTSQRITHEFQTKSRHCKRVTWIISNYVIYSN